VVFTRRGGREFNQRLHREGMLQCPITDAMARRPAQWSIVAVEPGMLLRASVARRCEVLATCNASQPQRTSRLERLLPQCPTLALLHGPR
jgi:hypothetical protein